MSKSDGIVDEISGVISTLVRLMVKVSAQAQDVTVAVAPEKRPKVAKKAKAAKAETPAAVTGVAPAEPAKRRGRPPGSKNGTAAHAPA